MNSGLDRRLVRAQGIVLVPLLLLSLSCDRLSPEERVRQTIGEAVAAARDADAESLAGMISERYRDPMGHGRQELLALIDFHLCHEDALYLLEKVRTVRGTGPERVEAQVLLGVAGVPIEDLTKLNRFSADLLLIDLVFEKEERTRWRVVGAQWRRAEPADLL